MLQAALKVFDYLQDILLPQRPVFLCRCWLRLGVRCFSSFKYFLLDCLLNDLNFFYLLWAHSHTQSSQVLPADCKLAFQDLVVLLKLLEVQLSLFRFQFELIFSLLWRFKFNIELLYSYMIGKISRSHCPSVAALLDCEELRATRVPKAHNLRLESLYLLLDLYLWQLLPSAFCHESYTLQFQCWLLVHEVQFLALLPVDGGRSGLGRAIGIVGRDQAVLGLPISILGSWTGTKNSKFKLRRLMNPKKR